MRRQRLVRGVLAAAALGVAAACAKKPTPTPDHPALPAATAGTCLPDTGGTVPSPARRPGWTSVSVNIVTADGDLRMLFLADSAGGTRLSEMGPLGPTGEGARTWTLVAAWGPGGNPVGVQATAASPIRAALEASLRVARTAADTLDVLRNRVRNVPAAQPDITPLTPASATYATQLAGWIRTRCAGVLGTPH